MEDLVNFVLLNKEWIFSGIGVFIISLIFLQKKSSRIKINQKQISGDNSSSTQIGNIRDNE